MLGGNGPRWEDLGIPEGMLPAPPPFLPVPRGLIRRMEGLGKSWTVQVLKADNTMEVVGAVWGEDKEEAEEAAENLVAAELGKNLFGVIKAVAVVKS